MSTTAMVALYDLLRDAIARTESLVIDYATGDTEVKRRVIVPHALYAARNGDCLNVTDSLRNGRITLRVDYIRVAWTLDALLAGEDGVITAPLPCEMDDRTYDLATGDPDYVQGTEVA